MSIWLRNLIYLCLLGCLLPWILYRAFKTQRYRHSWRQMLLGTQLASAEPESVQPAMGESMPRFWLHGVSVGEIRLLVPIAESLRERYPTARIAVSVTTDAGMQLAQASFSHDVQVFYFPLDFSWAMGRVLDSFSPTLIVLGELELWPNLLAMAEQRNVPVAVINGRLSERSFRGYRRFHRLTEPMFGRLSCVCAQSPEYARRFEACGVPSQCVTTTGSLKFDNAQSDRNTPEIQQLRQLVGLRTQHTVLVAGSTQIEEEQGVLSAFDGLHGTAPDLRLILVPRHPERFEAVAAHINSLVHLRCIRRSQLTDPVDGADWDVLLVDTVGELGNWWGIAEHALVGGSFGSRGGQNMIEPAAFGANVAFGPNTSNFKDVAELLLSHDAAVRLHTPQEIQPWLTEQLSAPEQVEARGHRAAALVAQQHGAKPKTLASIDQLVQEQVARLRCAA